MTVILHHSGNLPNSCSYGRWFATTGTDVSLQSDRKLPRLAERLEAAFNASRDLWGWLDREMGGDASAAFAQTPTGGGGGADFGVMLAWERLLKEVAGEEENCLAVCDDPWLFRHLARIAEVRAGEPPRLWPQALRLWVRGVLARGKAAFSCAWAALRLRRLCGAHESGAYVILVYGHPESTADGHDAYFGDLMTALPGLKRLLHTDCPAARATELSADGRTASLHAWGSLAAALCLAFTRWRPRRSLLEGEHGWLMRRAAAKENGGGGPAMTRWQLHCQKRWLQRVRPSRVVWPWENHAWERGLCRAARKLGVPTAGYQHTVVGPHLMNYSSATNHDGVDGIPDQLVCGGPAYRAQLVERGFPEARMTIGGAFRIRRHDGGLYDPDGPVYVPLTAVAETSLFLVEAARRVAGLGRKVLVKEHPMYPHSFTNAENLERTERSLFEQPGLSAVLFCTGTSGLEAMLAGLPIFRLLQEDRISIDILPSGVEARNVSLDGIVEAFSSPAPPSKLDWESIFSSPDMDVWRRLLSDDMKSPA